MDTITAQNPLIYSRLLAPVVLDEPKLEIFANTALPLALGTESPSVSLIEASDERETTLEERQEELKGRVAIIPVYDTLVSRHAVAYSGMTGYSGLERRIDYLVEEGYTRFLFTHDSPGGEVPRCFALSRKIRELSTKHGFKTAGYVEGMSCSGSYALLSGVGRIFIDSTSMLGSIGVFNIWFNQAKFLEDKGIEWKIFRAGKHKAEVNSLESLSEDSINHQQAKIDELYKVFAGLVSDNRKVLSEEKIYDLESRSFGAADSIELKLADEVVNSMEAAIEYLLADEPKTKPKMESLMSQQTTTAAEESVKPKVAASQITQQDVDNAVAAERQRCAEIFASGAEFGVSAENVTLAIKEGYPSAMVVSMFGSLQAKEQTETEVEVDEASNTSQTVSDKTNSAKDGLASVAEGMWG